MPKQKTRKSILKRLKITSTGKLLKRHQLGAGHRRRNKSKSALARHARTSEVFKGDAKAYKRALGL